MKGAKGGNRDRIISWLFSEKNRKKREEEIETEKVEESKTNEKNKHKQKDIESEKQNTNTITNVNNLEQNDNNSYTTSHDEKVTEIRIEDDESEIYEDSNNHFAMQDNNIVIEQSENSIDASQNEFIPPKSKVTVQHETKNVQKPSNDTVIEKEIKNNNDNTDSFKPVNEIEVTPVLNENSNKIFPAVDERTISDEVVDVIEKPELIKISIIEEIEKLIKNDFDDLKDIKYRIEVLNQLKKDEVLLENIEKIQKELELLIKRFEEIKKKYDFIYSYISISDLELISGFNIENIVSNYISDGKGGIDSHSTINQIREFEEFIEIINEIIDIEKQKDLVQDSVEHKLLDFNIRDDEFIKLQDQYLNIEGINKEISKYNAGINAILNDIENKIANSIDVSNKIKTTISIVPDVNRIIGATMLMASAKMIPPTPAGNLFKTTLLVSAVHMMTTAFTPKEETKTIERVTVDDYSRDILNTKQDFKNVLNNINNAFSEITYMKDLFQKEFSQYRNEIPDYDELIKNIFKMETELARQQSIVYDYDNKFDQALALNNQKVKVLEND